ncbi:MULTISPECIES: hypothetical protein [Streptomyces]|uniref:Uncharacterized protein n=2 Tax=Streptomyces TaxID=1883 RepID=A0A2N8PLA9_STRNR|nr:MULTISPECIES: hypothetical protein [Streptomyces]AJC59132.1 hypothetical protein GZL_06563 [Streptomyces sp. 769]PNE41816.1 hypothetical protein AOB60_14565 [Streptomyces noursei]SHL93707.1 hypothetical protein SAMN05216268_107154 [Streptomyces yunnanensis]
MEAELVALATAGATTLVQQMATEGWATVRRRMAAVLARRRGAEEEAEVERELDQARTDVISAREDGDEEVPQGVAVVWKARLRRLLAEDPAAAAELRRLLDEVAPQGTQSVVRDVHNTISGGVMTGPVVQAGVVFDHRGTPPGGPQSR